MRAVSRKDFLRHGGAGLIDAMLRGAAGCNSRNGKVVIRRMHPARMLYLLLYTRR
jgi:hypothetical protein